MYIHKLPLLLNIPFVKDMVLYFYNSNHTYSFALGRKMDLLWDAIIELIFLMQL